jgi:ABC-type uncharacterized transport system permease subunit
VTAAPAARPGRAALWLTGGLAVGALLGAGVGMGFLPPWAAVAVAALVGVLVGRKVAAARRRRR